MAVIEFTSLSRFGHEGEPGVGEVGYAADSDP